MTDKNSQEIKKAVMDKYSRVPLQQLSSAPSTGAGCCSSACCGGTANLSANDISGRLSYSEEDLGRVPEGANLGLGCGNPHAIASLRSGETVLDLGCGGGFDCFLASGAVGTEGKVIGVDMTAEMLSLARENAAKGGYENVTFRLGEIEHLPAADSEADVIISNCVINLAADKRAVYNEAFRVLKPGGRLAVSDVVAFAPVPEEVRRDLELWAACAAGALMIDELETILKEAGFSDIRINMNPASRDFIKEWVPGRGLEDCLASAAIEAVKPER